MAGRKAKPQKLKVIQGTARKDRTNKNAPIAAPDVPMAPKWLNERAREIFSTITGRIEVMGYASTSHTEMLALAAMRLAEVEEYTTLIDVDGPTYRTTNTQGDVSYKPRPEVMLRSEAARHAQSLLAEFGLSAASMQKIVVPEKPKKSEWDEVAP